MGFCDSGQSQSTSNNYGWENPLGPSSIGKNGKPVFSATGAPQMAGQLFNYLGSDIPQMAQAGTAAAGALTTAAANPGWGAAANNATQTAQGDYLGGSPELNQAMAWNQAQDMAGAANQNERINSNFAKNGMGFSTSNEQAQQANTAAETANAMATNAQLLGQNYLAERNNQNSAAAQLATATGTPLSYLGGVSGAYAQPLTQAGNLISGLASGGQMFNTGTNTSGTYSPSTGSDILNGIGAL